MISSDVTIEIDSRRCGRSYEVLRFTEFDVDLDLETDADSFDFVASNPNGLYTGLFCRFDSCRLKVNGVTIMKGNIDSVGYYIKGSKNYIKIAGRDLCWKLVDNDSLPDSIEQLVPKAYIERKCSAYGIGHNISDAETYNKLVIGCGESEISIMNNILLDSKQRIWYLVDTLYTGDWSTNASPSHVFSYSQNVSGIPIDSDIEFTEDGTDMMSKLLLYGSDEDGNQKVMGQSSNQYMLSKGVKKRRVRRHYSDSASSKYASIASKDMRDNFRDDTELKIKVPIMAVYMPNTTAQVIIDKLGINALFFIKRVQYMKNIDAGSCAYLTLIPADPVFESLWQSSTAISITNFTPMSSQLANAQASNVYSSEVINLSDDDSYVPSSTTSSGNFFPACSDYTGCSIVDGLKSIGATSSYSYRCTIASANGISGYKGSASQNTSMLNMLNGGTLIKPS